MTKIQAVAKTHVGQVREHNEDSFIVGLDPVADQWVLSFDEIELNPKGAVFVVADGMGGENAGEIASEIAVQSIKAYIQAELKKEQAEPVNKILESSLIYAHNRIKDACRTNADYIGMGTTACVCMLTENKLYISWIGDSRVYRYPKHGRVHGLPYHFGNLEILSEDHSKVWQMMRQGQLTLEETRTHQESNIITQSLGDLFRTPQPESREYPLFQDDHILLCSDGLNGMLSDQKIEELMRSEYGSLDNLAEQLITEANEAGGNDNITLILSRVTEGLPYSDENLLKLTGEKTVKTELIDTPKSNKYLWVSLIMVLVALVLSFFYRDKIIDSFRSKPSGIEHIPDTIKQSGDAEIKDTLGMETPEVKETSAVEIKTDQGTISGDQKAKPSGGSTKDQSNMVKSNSQNVEDAVKTSKTPLKKSDEETKSDVDTMKNNKSK